MNPKTNKNKQKLASKNQKKKIQKNKKNQKKHKKKNTKKQKKTKKKTQKPFFLLLSYLKSTTKCSGILSPNISLHIFL